MFYEPYARQRRRPGCLGCLGRFIVLLAAALAILFLATSGLLDKMIRPGEYRSMSASRSLPPGVVNVLLLGTDAAQEGARRSDTMMIASIGINGQLKLTSVMRDTLVNIEGHGKQKLNAAFAFGGAELTAGIINDYFDMDITRYAVIDYAGFAALIDAMGGVDVNVTQKEMQAMNQNLDTASKRKNALKTYGENTHLNGAQALRYSRLRKLDSDYRRAARQRTVVQALIQKATKNPLSVIGAVTTAARTVQTNMSVVEIAALGARVLLNDNISTLRIPADDTFDSGTLNGVWSIRPDFEKNKQLLHAFIYE